MMKRLLNILLSVACLCFVVACQSGVGVALDDFSAPRYSPKYASGFTIKTLPDSTATLVKIITPWQGATDNDHHLIIMDEGMTPPENFEGAVLNAPAQRVITLSSSNIAMFEAIGESRRIVGVSGIEYITNEEVIESYNQGRTLDIGYGNSLNYEAIIALQPDLVLLYGVAGEEVSVTSKLEELGIQYIYIGDYAEQSPLAKAEWMVVMGEICGVREEAMKRFSQIDQRYCALRDSVVVALQPTDSLDLNLKPKVMLNTPYRDVWHMPSSSSYIVQLIEDAGAEYIYKDNNTSTTQPISLERAYELVASSDFWLNMGAGLRTVEALKAQNPMFADMEVVARGRLYNTTARSTEKGGSDFWESGVVNPDVVLSDLVKIFHPELAKGHSLYYYEKLK